MVRLDINALTLWITAAAIGQPDALAQHLVQRSGMSRATARKALRRLVELNWLVREGTRSRPHYRPGLLRQATHRYALAGLQEDLPWSRDFAPVLQLPRPLLRMVQHSFTELLNNAIDHSDGSSVTVSLRQTPSQVQLLVSDDGRGLFDKIESEFALGDPNLAMLELSKGKLTSLPARHSGRGLYFTARLADVFDLHANETAFQRRAWDEGGWRSGRPLKRQGTSVYAAFAIDTQRTLESVVAASSLDGKGMGFDRTVVPLRLMASDSAGLESRSQARRVAARLEQFQRVEVDFSGVAQIGHSFADELFRVLAPSHGRAELVPVNMSAAVAAMVATVHRA